MDFVILLKIVLINLPTLILSEICKQTGPCSCETSDSILDLSPLTSPNPNPKLIVTDGDQKYEYSFMPCVALKGSTCGSSYPVAVCQKDLSAGGQSFIAGEVNTASFYTNMSNNFPGISYYSTHGPAASTNRTSKVLLICSTSESFKFYAENPTQTYSFELSSPAACFHPKPSSGVSTGTVLLIIFMILVLLYIVVGILYMHYIKGAQGIEKFPNIEFWKEFPLLVRDGCLFVIRGCKADTTYSKI